jgi:hypothetical protein
VLRDSLDRGRDRGARQLGQRVVHLDQHVEVADVHEALTQRAGHVGVYLGNDAARHAQGGRRHLHGDAEAAVAVGIGWADLQQRDVEAHAAAVDQLSEVAQMHGDPVGASGIDRRAVVGAGEPALVPHALAAGAARLNDVVFGAQVIERAEREQMGDAHVLQLGAAAIEGRQQVQRNGAVGVHVDMVARANLGRGVI